MAAPAVPARSSLTPTVVVAVLVLAALVWLLWTGLHRENPTPEATAPAVIVPSAPVITGALDEAAPRLTGAAPTIAVSQVTPTAPAAIQPAPAVAPTASFAISVPNVQGLTISGATQALLPLGLRITLDQTVFSDSVPLNAVAAQDPLPGSLAMRGDIIRVSLSRGPSPFADSAQP
jgi:hypothetical protein